MDAALNDEQLRDDRRMLSYPAMLLLFLLVISGIRLALILLAPVDLSGDEAQYWDWSRRLELSYYSKPPGVAYLIWLSCRVFGDNILGVRAWPILFSVLTSLTLYKLTARIYDRKTGLFAGTLLQVVPLFSAYGIGMTPDTPLAFFWVLSLLLFHVAVHSPRGIWPWLALGASLGLGLLCKYAIIFFVPCALLYLAVTPAHRGFLRRPHFYAALLIAAAFLTPVILWNARHGWVNFRHDLGHTKIGQGFRLDLLSFLDLIGSQVAVITPVILILALIAVIKYRRRDPLAFWFSIPILAGFVLKSLQAKVQANWPLTAWPAVFMPFAHMFLRNFGNLKKSLRILVVFGIALAVFMTVAGMVIINAPAVLSEMGVPPQYDPTIRLRGYHQLGDRIHELEQRMTGDYFIFTDYYMLTAEAAFYTPGQPRVYYVNPGSRRMNQYDLWPWFGDRIGQDAIFVSVDGIADFIAKAFESHEHLPLEAKDSRGQHFRTFHIYICRGFKGMPRPEPKGY